MIKKFEQFVLWLHKKYGLTPKAFFYLQIFAGPWLALLISKVLSGKSLGLAGIIIIIYLLIVATHFLGHALSLALAEGHDEHGKMLQSLGDKIFIVFLLIPFGLNLFTFLIILAESIIAFQIIFWGETEKQIKYSEKIKKFLQIFLIPILIVQATSSLIPDMLVYVYIILTILTTYVSVYFHFSPYFYVKNE